MSYTTLVTPADVVDPISFAAFAQQTLGTPAPAGRDIIILRRKLKDWFAATPDASWSVLVATVQWCKAKRRRPATPWGVIANVRWAWADGAVPELDAHERTDPVLEGRITTALETETEERWRRMLIGASGLENRREVYSAWRRVHA